MARVFSRDCADRFAHSCESMIQFADEQLEPIDLRGAEPALCKNCLIMPEWLIEVDPAPTLLTVRRARDRGKF